jgi:hypothetical protein
MVPTTTEGTMTAATITILTITPIMTLTASPISQAPDTIITVKEAMATATIQTLARRIAVRVWQGFAAPAAF